MVRRVAAALVDAQDDRAGRATASRRSPRRPGCGASARRRKRVPRAQPVAPGAGTRKEERLRLRVAESHDDHLHVPREDRVERMGKDVDALLRPRRAITARSGTSGRTGRPSSACSAAFHAAFPARSFAWNDARRRGSVAGLEHRVGAASRSTSPRRTRVTMAPKRSRSRRSPIRWPTGSDADTNIRRMSCSDRSSGRSSVARSPRARTTPPRLRPARPRPVGRPIVEGSRCAERPPLRLGEPARARRATPARALWPQRFCRLRPAG